MADSNPFKSIEKTGLTRFWSNLSSMLSTKQPTLTEGTNIDITNSVISADGDNSITAIPVDPSTKPSKIGSIWFDSSSSSSQGSTSQFSILKFFPVGCIYLTIDNKNPSTFIGGTWSQISAGKILVGVGTGIDVGGNTKAFTAGANDGEYCHTLTTDELPAHTHPYTGPAANKSAQAPVTGTDPMTSVSGSRSTGNASGSAGSGVTHNNVQPTYGLYIWQRTA